MNVPGGYDSTNDVDHDWMAVPNEQLTYSSMLCMYHLIEPARQEAIISPISQMAKMRRSEAKPACPSFYS